MDNSGGKAETIGGIQSKLDGKNSKLVGRKTDKKKFWAKKGGIRTVAERNRNIENLLKIIDGKQT